MHKSNIIIIHYICVLSRYVGMAMNDMVDTIIYSNGRYTLSIVNVLHGADNSKGG